MEITIDITKIFRYVVNYTLFFDCDIAINPVIFFEKPFKYDNIFNFELMNFALNIEQEMNDEFLKKSPHFDDIINCDVLHKSVIIIGRAKFKITNLKGLGLMLTTTHCKKELPPLYFEHPCKIKKGDYVFDCGGNSTFSPHFIKAIFITDKDAKVTVSFSSKDYLLKTSCDKQYENRLAKKQTPYSYIDREQRIDILSKCSKKEPRVFNDSFITSNFDGDDIARNDEWGV